MNYFYYYSGVETKAYKQFNDFFKWFTENKFVNMHNVFGIQILVTFVFVLLYFSLFFVNTEL